MSTSGRGKRQRKQKTNRNTDKKKKIDKRGLEESKQKNRQK